MSINLAGNTDFFGLDIGTTAVRLVHLKGNNPKVLVKYAYVPIDAKLSLSESVADQNKLMQVVSQLISQSNLATKNVVVGVPSNKVFTTVADVERLNTNELSKAITYQADSLIPTPLDESKIDWAIIGDSPSDKTKQEILLTSIARKYAENRLDQLESIGLNVIALEPDNLAIARSLIAPDDMAPSLLLDVGRYSTDLVIMYNNLPHLTRSIPNATDAIIKAASQNLNIDIKQAEQFVYKFGLDKSKLEGQIYDAILNNVEVLCGEIEKSIKFFTTRYSSPVSKLIVTGGASVIPEFPLYLANKFSVNVEIGNAWRNVSFSQDRLNELQSISNQFAVAVGLSERLE